MDKNKLRKLAGLPIIESHEPQIINESDNFGDLMDRFMDEEARNLEGRQGLISLAKICRAIGYKDHNYSGQLDQNASIGDITNFLEDNSGAIEAIIEFIIDRASNEWEESLRDTMSEMGILGDDHLDDDEHN